MIGLVDYGLGNIQAFSNIYRRLGIETFAVRTASDLRSASRLILPGVGAFDWAMRKLQESGLRDVLDEEVLGSKKPVLGVCVGMQMMARSSEEGVLQGLGWLDATVVKFDTNLYKSHSYLPHMGWNDVSPVNPEILFSGLHSPRFYFLHSYFMKTNKEENILATSKYGIKFTAAVQSKNVYGTQFHPEKSHGWGIKLLKNFSELA